MIPEFCGTISVIQKAVSDQDNDEVMFYRPVRIPEKTLRLKNKQDSSDPQHHMKQNGWIAGNLYLDKEDLKDKYFDTDGCSLNKISGMDMPIAEVNVSTITLDTWDSQQDNEYYDVAWIDTQGAEKKVLDGATETLKKINYVYIEHSQENYEDSLSKQQTIEIMKKNGFDHHLAIDDHNLLFGKHPGWII